MFLCKIQLPGWNTASANDKWHQEHGHIDLENNEYGKFDVETNRKYGHSELENNEKHGQIELETNKYAQFELEIKRSHLTPFSIH